MAEKEDPKVLIDACVTPALVEHLLHHRGIDAIHAGARLPPGASDKDVVALAHAEGRIILTINAEDFRKLASANPSHPGLVILPAVHKAGQLQYGESAIDRILADLRAGRRPDGHVYEVDTAGRISRYKLPAGDTL